MKNILEILKRPSSGDIKISMIVSTDPAYPDSRQNSIRLKNAVKKAMENLAPMVGEEQAEKTGRKLLSKLEEVDLVHVRNGLGVFFSPDVFEVYHFPFPVQEHITVGPEFNLQALEDDLQKQTTYWVLAISKGHTRLLQGINDRIKEVNDDFFPAAFENEFQLGHTLPNYSREESQVNLERWDSFLRKLDQRLGDVLREQDIPLVLAGVQDDISEFRKLSKHTGYIVLEVKGNHDRASEKELSEKIWPLLRAT